MATDRHKAVWDWLQTCPYIGDMFFNAGRIEDGNTELIPSEQEIETYIDGSSRRNYNVALSRYMGFSTDPNDESNITDVVDFDRVGDWVEEKLDSGNLPVFPTGCVITDIEVLTNNSGFMVAQDMSFTKYMIQFRIEYIRPRHVAPPPSDNTND